LRWMSSEMCAESIGAPQRLAEDSMVGGRLGRWTDGQSRRAATAFPRAPGSRLLEAPPDPADRPPALPGHPSAGRGRGWRCAWAGGSRLADPGAACPARPARLRWASGAWARAAPEGGGAMAPPTTRRWAGAPRGTPPEIRHLLVLRDSPVRSMPLGCPVRQVQSAVRERIERLVHDPLKRTDVALGRHTDGAFVPGVRRIRGLAASCVFIFVHSLGGGPPPA